MRPTYSPTMPTAPRTQPPTSSTVVISTNQLQSTGADEHAPHTTPQAPTPRPSAVSSPPRTSDSRSGKRENDSIPSTAQESIFRTVYFETPAARLAGVSGSGAVREPSQLTMPRRK